MVALAMANGGGRHRLRRRLCRWFVVGMVVAVVVFSGSSVSSGIDSGRGGGIEGC